MLRKRHLLPLVCMLAVVTGMLIAAYRSGSLHRLWDVHVLRHPVLDAPSVVELGPQEYGGHAEDRFAVTNRGGGELRLDNFRTACACDGVERKVGDRYVRLTDLTLAAGESAELRLVQQVRGRVGEPLRSAVYFRTNVPSVPEAAVVVSIPRVLGGVTAVPASAHVGAVPVGANVRQVIDLFDAAARPRVVKQVTSSDPSRFAVRLLPPDPATPARDGVHREAPIGWVEVVVDTTRTGPINGDIRLVLDDGQAVPDSIRVSGRVVASIEVMPSALVLPRSSNDGPIYSGICLCRSTAGHPLTLEPETAPPGISVTVTAAAGGSPAAQLVTIAARSEPPAEASRPRSLVVRLTATVDGVRHLLEIPVQVLSTPRNRPPEGAPTGPSTRRIP